MRNGLLAEWRRGIVARGLAAAALLAVPVGVAAAIGFGTSVAGLSEGLGSLANGPESSQALPATTDSDAIDTAITAIATTAPADSAAPGGRTNGVGPGGSEAPANNTPGGSSPQESPAGGGGPATVVDPPEVEVPNGNPVNDLVDGLNDTINGLLGGGQ